MKFKSKIDLWWWIFLLIFNFILINFIFTATNKVLLILMIVVNLFLLSISLLNYVLLEEENIKIVFGLIRLKIKYQEILSITKNLTALNAVMFSLSLSRDYLIIDSKKYLVSVAVKDKEKFIDELSFKCNNLRIK